MVKGVLFDFDGTLADSSEGIFHTALYSIRQLGITQEYDEEQLRRFVGPPLRDCFRVAFGLDPALIDDAVRIYRDEYQRKGYKMMRLYPGMRNLLIRLRGMGIMTGMATFKGEELVKSCLDSLGVLHLFDSVHGSDERESRTKGDIIRMVLSDMSLAADEALMVGDTVNDQKGADDAGVPFLAVTYGFGFRRGEEMNGRMHADDTEGILRTVDDMNGGKSMIEKIETKSAPAAIGPYSQAVKANGMLFASGQIPIDPATGAIVEGSAADQARQVFKNINAVLAAAGTDISKVVKATVFLKDMADFATVNEVYAQAFASAPVLPARSAVAVKTLPKDVQVEIEVIALL